MMMSYAFPLLAFLLTTRLGIVILKGCSRKERGAHRKSASCRLPHPAPLAVGRCCVAALTFPPSASPRPVCEGHGAWKDLFLCIARLGTINLPQRLLTYRFSPGSVPIHRDRRRSASLLALCWLTALSLLFLLLTPLIHAESPSPSPTALDKPTLIVVVGASGEEDYGTAFRASAQLWLDAAHKGGADAIAIGLEPTNEIPDLEKLKHSLAAQPTNSPAELWLVLLGHGTFDGHEAKFNLRGPDLSATDLAALLKPLKRPLAVIDCSAASAPFLNKLSAPGRVIITATRSGREQNYTRFGRFISEAIADPAADLDKDGQTSLLEAFLMASRRVGEFYAGEGRLATEHALLDDNGDGLGAPADWFRGIHPVKHAKDGAVDGLRAHQFCLVPSEEERRLSPEIRARRDELELAVAKLRDTKKSLAEDDYYSRLELLLVQLAKISGQPAVKAQ